MNEGGFTFCKNPKRTNGKVADVVLIAINKTKVLGMKYWRWTDINVLLLVQFLSLSQFSFVLGAHEHTLCFLNSSASPTGSSSSSITATTIKPIARTLLQCAVRPGRWVSAGCTVSSRDAAQPVVVLMVLRSQWTRQGQWQWLLGSIKSSHQAFSYQNKCIAGGWNVNKWKVDYIDLKTGLGKLKENRLWWRYSSDKRQRADGNNFYSEQT